MKRSFAPAIVVFAALGCGQVDSADTPPSECGDALTDAEVVIHESPRPRPELGRWLLDPDLGGCMARVSDHRLQDGTSVFGVSPTRQAWNADGTRVLLASGHVLDARDFRIENRVAPPAVWAPDASGVLYRVKDASLLRVDIESGSETELVRFPEYTELDSERLGEPSVDGRHLALLGKRVSDSAYEVFLWDLVNHQKSPTLSAPFDAVGRSIDPRWVTVSPSGRFVVIGWRTAGAAAFRGIELYDAKLSRVSQLSESDAEADVTLDADGTECLVQARLGEHGPMLEKIELAASPATRELVGLKWFHAVRVSCRAHGHGSCLLSTQGDPASGWQPFANEVFEVFLDSTPESPRVARRVHHRSAPEWLSSLGECELSPQAVLPNPSSSRDGSVALFTSNWSRHCFGELYLIRQ